MAELHATVDSNALQHCRQSSRRSQAFYWHVFVLTWKQRYLEQDLGSRRFCGEGFPEVAIDGHLFPRLSCCTWRISTLQVSTVFLEAWPAATTDTDTIPRVSKNSLTISRVIHFDCMLAIFYMLAISVRGTWKNYSKIQQVRCPRCSL